jgi:hypothetical protein
MTLALSTRYKPYQPVVLTTDFPITFPIFSTTDVTVYADGIVTALFSITATFVDGRSVDAVVVLNTAVTGIDVEIYGTRSPRRENQYLGNSPQLADNLQNDVDAVTAVQQEQARDYATALRISPQDPLVSPLSGNAASRAGRAPIFSSDGLGLEAGPTANEISSAQGYSVSAAASAASASASAAIYKGPRDASNAAAIASLLADGEVGMLGGLLYEKDSTATGAASCTNDLGVDGLIPSGNPISILHFGMPLAPTDGATERAAAQTWALTNGRDLVVPKGTYVDTATTYVIPMDAKWQSGTFSTGVDLLASLARSQLFITGETSSDAVYALEKGHTPISVTLHAKGGQHGNAARFNLYNYSTFAAGNTGIYAFAMGSTGNIWTAASHGEAFHASGTTIAGNFELGTFSTAGGAYAIVATARGGAGYATLPTNGALPAEHPSSVGLYINGALATSSQKTFKYGIRVASQSMRASSTSIRLDADVDHHLWVSSGAAASVADIYLQADSNYGIILAGNYTNSAIRMNKGQTIAFDAGNAITMGYNATTLEFKSAGIERVGIEMSGVSPGISVSGNQVLGAQQSALPADATDLTTAMALVNAMKVSNVAHGLNVS